MRGFIFNHVPLMITCRVFENFIIAYLEDDLPERQRAVFELHLLFCPECRDYLAAYRAAKEVAKHACTIEPPRPSKKMPKDLIRAIHAARQA